MSEDECNPDLERLSQTLGILKSDIKTKSVVMNQMVLFIRARLFLFFALYKMTLICKPTIKRRMPSGSR